MHKAPPPPDQSRWQRWLNEYWPCVEPDGSQHGRNIPDQPNPFPVLVRVVWAKDGEEWLESMARRWTRDAPKRRIRAAVYVTFSDPRSQTSGIWVKPSDVKRR